MEWAPLSGTLPPLQHGRMASGCSTCTSKSRNTRWCTTASAWRGSKDIFWLEWTHRLWGRLIGVAFLVPLVVVRGRASMIPRPLIPRLALFFVLGGLQGAVGWFMVASGFFPDSTAVSPYRLVIHLALALLLYAAPCCGRRCRSGRAAAIAGMRAGARTGAAVR